MDSGYIAVLDSGIGGLSVLKELIKIMPNEKYIYLGDNKNAPYGDKGERELSLLVFDLINQLSFYPLKALVIGCNTLSVTILEQIKKMVYVPVFGVFPPIESLIYNKQSGLLLCTPNTAKKYAYKYKNIDVLSLSYLAKDIEEKIFCIDKLNIDFHFENAKFYSANKAKFNYFYNYDRVIFGCTHYFFVKKQILDHFDHLKITSGNHFTALKVKKYLENKKPLDKNKRFSILFLGENRFFNQKIFEKVVFYI